MSYIRGDLPVNRRTDLEHTDLENLCFELNLNKRKWCISFIYKPPSLSDKDFENYTTNILDRIIIKIDHLIVLGDLNFDTLNKEKSKPITTILDKFNLTNTVKKPTCFKNHENPTMLDLIITNSPSLLCNTSVFNCSLSDCHSFILTCIKEHTTVLPRKSVSFRSYKIFNEVDFNNALNQVPFHVALIFDDIDDNYWCYEKLFFRCFR